MALISPIFQLLLDFSVFTIEFLTVLNGFNGTKLDNLLLYCIPTFITGAHLAIYKSTCVHHVLPSLLTYLLGLVAQSIWYTQFWQVYTRHRTEFYDTHAVLCAMMYVLIVRGLDNLDKNKRI